MKNINYLFLTALLFMGGLVNAQEDTSSEEIDRAPYDFLDMFSPDRRDKEIVMTQTAFLIGFGFNQAVGNGNGIGEDYRFWGSGLFDVGLEFSTRLNKESDLLRFTYGLSLRFNSLRLNNNKAFATIDNVTTLDPIGFDIDRSRFSQAGFHVPFHLEIGKRQISEYRDGIKRSGSGDENSFVVGLGGYLGYTTTSTQTLEFEREGRDITIATTNDYEINNFNYGLSIYAGYEDLQLFATYGLNDIFKDSPVQQSYLSFGIRLR
jgi:hypothetical protein